MTPALSAVPGTFTALLISEGTRLVDSWPLPADWLPLIGLAVVFGTVFVRAQPRRRSEAPLRLEMRARPMTFRSSVDAKLNVLGLWGDVNGMPFLAVHGDVFQASVSFPPGTWFGLQWCYRATETTMEVVPGWRHDWIDIAAQSPVGRPVRLRIGRRKMTREIWDALAWAGVQPVGAPPR